MGALRSGAVRLKTPGLTSAEAVRWPDLLLRIPELAARHRAGELSDGAYAALYFLHWQMGLYGERFASRLCRADPPADAHACMRLIETHGPALEAALAKLFQRYQFRGIIPSVAGAIAAWLQQRWPLRVLERVPTAREVLRMQADGVRPVTLLARYPRMLAPVLRKGNAFMFMVHDLEHAYKFYHDPRSHAQQRRLFQCLARRCKAGQFDVFLSDIEFAAKFDYLASDMNTHPLHSLQYLRAILIEHHAKMEEKEANEHLSANAEASVAALLAGVAREAGWGEGVRPGGRRRDAALSAELDLAARTGSGAARPHVRDDQ